ncbi:MAG: hypothetical protein JRI23_02915 [Deltaproteobacteria bacterium]|jgi:hypothetical protein|nr:hypothetical protein [Deltaproteobacteria bacterium]MBW2530457.1 hypothetical protein [Deltaproteobacteria bacterium]
MVESADPPPSVRLQAPLATGRDLPVSRDGLRERWADDTWRTRWLDAYAARQHSFVVGLLPEQAVCWPVEQTLELLRRRYGDAVDAALAPEATSRGVPREELDPRILSPVASQPDGSWLRRANAVGINVRTVGSFWNVIGYALTLPACHDAVHLLPIWEPGVVGSLYGPCSWELNQELFSAALAAAVPHLDRLDHQLRAVVHLLHLMGRAVGMDVIPHTDRFSQIALAYPSYFEWLRREDDRIADHRANLHEEVEQCIVEFVAAHGAAVSDESTPMDRGGLFGPVVGERRRQRILFGEPEDPAGRETRRIELVRHLVEHGYEPVPATMAPPYRGIEVDPSDEACTVDALGLRWRDFRIAEPQAMSRVFGPLGRYKLYERRDDNRRWQIDFERPRHEAWDYVCRHYAAVQAEFGFDFMRGDMSHVQMRPGGVPARPDDHYDLLGAVKRYVTERGALHFAYFAESFLAPRDVMAYGDEMDHLECSEAEVTLGNLQSMTVGSAEFAGEFRRYLDLLATRRCAPCFTMMTADKDDPRFDSFYLAGNALRMFVGLLLPDMPSYVGLGFEVRDPHPEPAPNEHYTKLFVFQQRDGKNATRGPYVWGQNGELFALLTRIRLIVDAIAPLLVDRHSRWLIPPDPVGHEPVWCWTLQGPLPPYVFVVNSDLRHSAANRSIPRLSSTGPDPHLELAFSTAPDVAGAMDRRPHFNGRHHRLGVLAPEECRIYRVAGARE